MKKSIIVLLIMVLVSSFAFAETTYLPSDFAFDTNEDVDKAVPLTDAEIAELTVVPADYDDGDTVSKYATKSYKKGISTFVGPEPKDSLELSGYGKATFEYDLLNQSGSFAKKANFAYFNLDATKVLTTGAGGLKGEGNVYANVAASFTFEIGLDTASDYIDADDGSINAYVDDDTWYLKTDTLFGFLDSVTMKLAIDSLYIAKDGSWKLDLMASDKSLDYAKSAISSKNQYYNKNNNYRLEKTGKVYASYAAGVTKHTGVTLTTEGNPYLAEVAFGMDPVEVYDLETGRTTKQATDTVAAELVPAFNALVKSQAITVGNVTFEAGAVLGTKETYDDEEFEYEDAPKAVAYTYLDDQVLNLGAGLKIAYADDVVTADVAADFGFEDLKDTKGFNADVAFNFAAAGVTFNFFYATNSAYTPDWNYRLYKAADGYTYKDLAAKNVAVALDPKYAEAKLAYTFNYADVDFTVGVTGKNLNWYSRSFGFVFGAKNDKFSFNADFDWVPGEKKDTDMRVEAAKKAYTAAVAAGEDPVFAISSIEGDFDVTYTADLFDVYADFEFHKDLVVDVDAEGTIATDAVATSDLQYGIMLGIESDKLVDGATFGLEFVYATAEIDDIVVFGKTSTITAWTKIAF